MTKNLCSRSLILASFILTVRSVSFGVDVNGPYKSGQTSIEYVVNQDGSVTLYGINCRDNPTDANGVMLYNTVRLGQSFWQTQEFRNALGQPLTDGYPVLLSRNNALISGPPVDYYSVSAITGDNHVYSARRSNPSQWFMFNHSGITTDIPTRVVYRPSQPEVQWLGLRAFSEGPNPTENPAMKSVDGWQNAVQAQLGPVPWPVTNPVFYSLAIEDHDPVEQAIAVVTTPEVSNHLGLHVRSWNGVNHPELAIYFTFDGGANWLELSRLWPEANPRPMNIQVAMVPGNPNSPTFCRNYLYIVSGHGINMRYDWTAIRTNGEFESHGGWAESLPPIEGFLPIEAMDLEATGLFTTEPTVRLVLTTTRGVYICDHHPETEEVLNWVDADPSEGIATENLWDVALDPLSPSDHFAVVGQAGCYQTTDAGVHWIPIYNDGQFHTYASGGVRQSPSAMVAGYVEQAPLYSIHELGDPVRNIYGVYVQLGLPQAGPDPIGRLKEIRQIGYAKAAYCGPCGQPPSCDGIPDTPGDVPLMTYSSPGGRFYIAYADAYIEHTNDPCTGVVSVSADDGVNWVAGEWTSCLFYSRYGQCHHAPIPASLMADPVSGERAYVTFKDAVYRVSSPTFTAPPFAFTNDGGLTWTIPENDGLPPEEWSNLSYRPGYFVAAWADETNTLLWLVGRPRPSSDGGDWSEARLWYSRDLGTGWTAAILSPGGQFWRLPTGIACQPDDYESIAVYGPDGIALLNGAAWIETPSPQNTEIDHVIADLSNPDLWWVSVHDTWTYSQQVYVVQRRGALDPVWHQIGPSWDTSTNNMKASLWLDPNEENVRRLFWSLSILPGQYGENFSIGPTVQYFEYHILPASVTQSTTITDPVVYMLSNVDVSSTATLTFAPGVTVYAAPGCSLLIGGSLLATDGCQFRNLDSTGTSSRWSGIYVTGNVTLSNCIISGATIGIESQKATALNLTNCTIQDCGTGFYAYQPASYAEPQITGCTFANNDNEGISLLGTVGCTITDCEFTDNGGNGILLTNSLAKISDSRFYENGAATAGYGLNCYGSSPVLYCNEFEDNFKGEIGLYNQSYPVLWAAGGPGSGGVNSLLNHTQTLISMWDSYPITKNGHNNFTVGSTGFFMADMSAAPKKRDISGNFWNPTLSLSKLYPSSSSVYTWTSTDPVANSCGVGGGGSGSGPEALFAQGFDAEMAGSPATAQTYYTQVMNDYPDSEWVAPASARLFDTQRQLDTGYVELQSYLGDVAEENSDDSALVKTLDAFSTRAWVEDAQYDPAFATYEQIMAEPPSSTDSIYAATDYAITAMRAQYDDGGSLDSYRPVVGMSTVAHLLNTVTASVPPVPQASHEGFQAIPTTVQLFPNYPNPFNAETTIQYYLPEGSAVRLEVYNIAGQRVTTLIDRPETAGFHAVTWNGADAASGLYICRLEAANSTQVQKMMLLK